MKKKKNGKGGGERGEAVCSPPTCIALRHTYPKHGNIM